jgi:hypothetical protein
LPDISKINALAIGSVSKVDGLAKASILDIDGVAVPAGFTGLLDTYPNSVGAYSVRRLNSSYTGAAMRVREDTTDVQTDIDFDSNGDLDTAAITAFATLYSATNVYVVYMYDQSQAGGTATGNDVGTLSAAAQPGILLSGSIHTENGKPALDYSSRTTNALTSQSNIRGATDDFSAFMVLNNGTSNFRWEWGIGTTNTNWEGVTRRASNTDFGIPFSDNTTLGATTPSAMDVQHLVTYTRGGLTSNGIAARFNSTPLTLSNQDATARTLVADVVDVGGRPTGGGQITGSWQEAIFYDFDQSSPTDNRAGIESNIDTYYSIP